MKALRLINVKPELRHWISIEGNVINEVKVPVLFEDDYPIKHFNFYDPLKMEFVNVEIVIPEDLSDNQNVLAIQDFGDSSTHVENERKWIMKSLPNLQWEDKIYIDQYYIMYDGKPHRVRFNYELNIWFRTSSGKNERKLRSVEFLHKEKIGKGQNIEHHINISYDEAKQLIKTASKRIVKVRYIYQEEHKFEIDVFLHSIYPRVGLTMMEVEIENIEQEIVFPFKIEELIKEEVTGLTNFDNYSLATENLEIED